MIKSAHINILEGSTVSLSAGTEDSAYPLYRLHDRNVGRAFRITAAETLEVKVDQGASGPYTSVDTLLVASGHNLAGMTLDIKHSDDDITYTPAVAQWTGTQGVMQKSWTGLSKRYWKFVVTSPSSIPSITELFLTSAYAWERMPERPAGPLEDVHNVMTASASDGTRRFLKAGPSRRRRPYRLPRCPDSIRDELLALWATWGEGRPVWLLDHEGQWIFAAPEGPLGLTEVAHGLSSMEVDFLEVLA